MFNGLSFHDEAAGSPNPMRKAFSSNPEYSVVKGGAGAADGERHRPAPTYISGRYMLADHCEYCCYIMELTPESMKLIAPMSGEEGEHVIAYVDHIGRLEGRITCEWRDGFSMSIQASERKRQKVATLLDRLQGHLNPQLSERREYSRFAPRAKSAFVTVPNEATRSVEIIDLSLAGARVAMSSRPKIGSNVILGRIACRVVRHTSEGIGVEFTTLQHPGLVEADVIARQPVSSGSLGNVRVARTGSSLHPFVTRSRRTISA